MGENKIMTAIYGNNIREIVNQSNKLGIPREDIVSLLRVDGQYVLIYYS